MQHTPHRIFLMQRIETRPCHAKLEENRLRNAKDGK